MNSEQKTPQFLAGFDLKGIAITFVVLVVIVGFGADFLADEKDAATAANQTEAAAIYGDGLDGLSGLTSKVPTMAKVIVLAVIIAVLSIVGVGMSRRR